MRAQSPQMLGQHFCRLVAVSRKHGHTSPQPRPQCYKEHKVRGFETTLWVDETGRLRHFEIELVGDYFCRAEMDSVCARSGGDCGRFHIHRLCAVGLCQVRFLIRVRHRRECYQQALSAFDFGPAGVSCIDHHGWGKYLADAQARIQCSGKTHRLEQHRTVQSDHCFRCPARRFHADSSANDNHFIVLEKNKVAALVLSLDTIAIPNEPADLALERTHAAAFRRSSWPDTTPLPAPRRLSLPNPPTP